LQGFDGEIREIEDKIKAEHSKVQKHRGKLEEVDGQSHNLKSDCDSKQKNITSEIVKKVNHIFDRDRPAPQTLIAGMECFVALLRNAKKASNVDVELYFASYEKLDIKLGRIQPTSLKYETVQHHQNLLNNLVSRFTGTEENESLDFFRPIVEWA